MGDIGWDELGDVEGNKNGDRETIPLSLSVKSKGKLSFSDTLVIVTGAPPSCFDFVVVVFCLFLCLVLGFFVCLLVAYFFKKWMTTTGMVPVYIVKLAWLHPSVKAIH